MVGSDTLKHEFRIGLEKKNVVHLHHHHKVSLIRSDILVLVK